jgi:hypothetical protein
MCANSVHFVLKLMNFIVDLVLLCVRSVSHLYSNCLDTKLVIFWIVAPFY